MGRDEMERDGMGHDGTGWDGMSGEGQIGWLTTGPKWPEVGRALSRCGKAPTEIEGDSPASQPAAASDARAGNGGDSPAPTSVNQTADGANETSESRYPGIACDSLQA